MKAGETFMTTLDGSSALETMKTGQTFMTTLAQCI